MPVQVTGKAPPRLLPEHVEDSARRMGVRALGSALVAIAVLCWISLLSWTSAEPAASMAAKPVRNLLGEPGAAASDLIVQSLGVGAALVLIGPMIWGLEMLASRQLVKRFALKAMLCPLGVLMIAGAASALPTYKDWPLRNGYGGMLGDLVFNMTGMAMLSLSQQHSGILATIVLAVPGIGFFLSALGLRMKDVAAGLTNRKINDEAAPEGVTVGAADTSHASEGAEDDFEEATADAVLPAPNPAAPDQRTIDERSLATARRVSKLAVEEAQETRGDTFDDETDEHTKAFAERFAPGESSTGAAPRISTPKAVATVAAATKPLRSVIAFVRKSGAYRRPRIELLKRPGVSRSTQESNRSRAQANARQLEAVLSDFGVKGAVMATSPGPVVTRYEFEPDRGVKISRIVGLADDVARGMGARSVRIAPIPGRKSIGIEVPNDEREPVGLRDILENETFRSGPAALPLALGKSISGDVVIADLARMPHLLVAGTTGSGKSVGINAMILSLLFKLDPNECRLLLIDPKMLELAQYNAIPHLLAPVITDAQVAADALEWAVREMEERYTRMAKLGVRNIAAFNARAHNAKVAGRDLVRTVQTGYDERSGNAIFESEPIDSAPMPYIVVVVDEFADLMLQAGKRVEASIQRLAQMARAAGIHLIMATQRPSVDVVTGTIKANFPMRLSFRVASRIDSRTILGDSGAEQLLGQGDMLLSAGSGRPLRVHGAFVGDDEIERVTSALRDQGEPAYVPELSGIPHPQAQEIADASAAPDHGPTSIDEQLYMDVVDVVLDDRKVSTGHLCRRLGIDEELAVLAIERLEREGLVGPLNRFGRREILYQPPSSSRHVA